MINLEIIEYFPKGIRPRDIHYDQELTVNLPVEGPATMDLKGDRDSQGNYPTRTIQLTFPVNHIEVPEQFSQAYREERKKREAHNFRFPNELVPNLLEFRLDSSSVLHWRENMVDWSVINSILRSGKLNSLPKEERDRFLKVFSPTAPGTIVESTDGNIILGARGSSTYLEGGVMAFPVGHPVYVYNERNREMSYLQNPLQGLSRQSVTEMNLPLYADMTSVFGALKDLYCVGAVRGTQGDHGSWNPMVIFVTESKWSTKQLREGHETAVDRYEHGRFIPVPIDAGILSSLLRGQYRAEDQDIPYSRLIDHGLGELLLYGRYRFGDNWYEQLAHELTTDSRFETTITEGNPFK